MWWRSSNRGVSVTCSLVGYRWLTMPIKNCISSRLSTGNWYWIRYDLIAAMMKSYHLDQQISNLSSLPSRARSLSTLPACKAPGNAMEKSWKSASLTAQPNFHRKKQNIMFHFPCWNKTTQIKIKIKKTSRCESTTPPHRTRVPQRSVAFRPFRKKKKTWIWQRRPRPPELRQSTSATNLDPRGNKKHQKVGFEEQHFWMKLDFFNVERKKAGVFGMTFFFWMIFCCWGWSLKATCLRDLDPFGWFFFEKAGFLRQAGLHGRLW